MLLMAHIVNRKVLFALLSAALAGCATSNTESQLQGLRQANRCCETIRSVPLSPWPATRTTDVDISDSDPVFDFKTGPSRFKAFRLPEFEEGRAIYVRSFVSPFRTVFHDGMTWGPLFYPALTFLDDKREEISTVIRDVPRPWCEGGNCSGVVTIAPIPVNARYVVVFTPADNVGKFRLQETTFEGMTVMVGGAFISTPGGTGFRRNLGSSTGGLNVWLQ